LIDLQDDTDDLVNNAVNMNINIDNYMSADSRSAGDTYGFVDFGDNLVDDLRVDSKVLE
jgi:hypothetical protein